jgi:hypothetical protein
MNLDYLYVFFQSSLLETLIYYFFYRSQRNLLEIIALVTFANAITHPLVFFGFLASPLAYLSAILYAELFAIAGEFMLHSYFGGLRYSRAGIASLSANLFSWQVAPMITYFIFYK